MDSNKTSGSDATLMDGINGVAPVGTGAGEKPTACECGGGHINQLDAGTPSTEEWVQAVATLGGRTN